MLTAARPEVSVEFPDLCFGFRSASHVETEVATCCAPTERGMIDVVIEYHDVPGIGFNRDAGHIMTRYAQRFS